MAYTNVRYHNRKTRKGITSVRQHRRKLKTYTVRATPEGGTPWDYIHTGVDAKAVVRSLKRKGYTNIQVLGLTQPFSGGRMRYKVERK